MSKSGPVCDHRPASDAAADANMQPAVSVLSGRTERKSRRIACVAQCAFHEVAIAWVVVSSVVLGPKMTKMSPHLLRFWGLMRCVIFCTQCRSSGVTPDASGLLPLPPLVHRAKERGQSSIRSTCCARSKIQKHVTGRRGKFCSHHRPAGVGTQKQNTTINHKTIEHISQAHLFGMLEGLGCCGSHSNT